MVPIDGYCGKARFGIWKLGMGFTTQGPSSGKYMEYLILGLPRFFFTSDVIEIGSRVSLEVVVGCWQEGLEKSAGWTLWHLLQAELERTTA